MKYVFPIVLVGGLIISEGYSYPGTTGFDFLKIEGGAREMAMGGTGIGSIENANLLLFNPASIAGLSENEASISYLHYVASIKSGCFVFSKSLKRFSLGAGFFYLNSGSMKKTNEKNDHLGSFSVHYSKLNLTGGIKIGEKISLGISTEALYAAIDQSTGLGIGFDAGAIYSIPYRGLNIGFSLRDAGFEIETTSEEREGLPTSFGVGASCKPIEKVNVAFDIGKAVDSDLSVKIGVEDWIHEYIALRIGFDSSLGDLKTGGGIDILAGVSCGLGFNYRSMRFDYGFTPYLSLGNVHRLTLLFLAL